MSTSLILYGNTPLTSPYVLSVFVALEEKALSFELRQLDLDRGAHLRTEYAGPSVTNRVPSLVHDGQWLSESSAITEYLDDVFAPPSYRALYPRGPNERARVRMVQALVRSDFLPLREERSTDTIFQGAPIKPLSGPAQAAAERLIRIAGQLISNGDRTIASEFSIADVDLATMLQRLVANGDAVPEPLATYARTIWRRPSVLKWLARTNFKDRGAQ